MRCKFNRVQNLYRYLFSKAFQLFLEVKVIMRLYIY